MERGKLYLIATPIGNLDDITLRALQTLKEVDIIAAEDTRQSIKLLNHFGISKKLITYHRHNEDIRKQEFIQLLREGKNILCCRNKESTEDNEDNEEDEEIEFSIIKSQKKLVESQ